MAGSTTACVPGPKAYRRWLSTIRFDHPAQQIVLQDYIHAVEDAEARLKRLERQIEEFLPAWSMAPVVEALGSP
jgi:transposase